MDIPNRVFAVDWSGSKSPTDIKKKIWLAEADEHGLRILKSGFESREKVAEYLESEAEKAPDFVVGLDFAFSFPSWFVEREGKDSAASFWRHVESLDSRWLEKPIQEPFYTKGKGPSEGPHRVTEKQAGQRIPGQSPDNVFHLVGAKQVGPGSVRGMPILKRLQDTGFSIWPFDPPKLPCVVEIYPRLFYGNLKKNRTRDRLDYLEPLPIPDKYHRAAATCSDDAFDAAVSALEMFKRREEFGQLRQTLDPIEKIEGCIWG